MAGKACFRVRQRRATPIQNGVWFVLRWGGAGFALLVLTCWASTFWAYSRLDTPTRGEVILALGTLEFRNAHYWDNTPGIDLSSILDLPTPSWSLDTLASRQSLSAWARSLAWLPACERTPTWKGNTSTLVRIPLWIPFTMSAAVSVWAWRRHWKRNRHGLCAKCGYDLAGLPDGAACPECGKIA